MATVLVVRTGLLTDVEHTLTPYHDSVADNVFAWPDSLINQALFTNR